jgi:TonB-dependent starch-binding outer membrane protein SusC
MKKLYMILMTLFVAGSISMAQVNVTGKVTDERGDPLIGASVQVKGTNLGTITDFDGNFSILAPAGSETLIISYLGYTEQEVDIRMSNSVSVKLASSGIALGDVIVVGYAEQTQRFSTQSVSTLKSDQIKDWPALSPQQLLQGQAAGVQMVNSSGLLGANATVRIRGAASITGGGQPLFVIDGVPLNDRNMSQLQGGGTGMNPLMNINPNDIESMTVLKDASAVAIYGSRGANGVILITTKKGGRDQKTNINLDMFTGFSNPTNLIEMMNTEQFVGFRNSYLDAINSTAPRLTQTDYFDWVGATTQTGRSNSVSLSMDGGNDRTTYFVGGNFQRESGFTIGNEYDRYAGRFNFSHQANDWLKVGTNMSLSNVIMDRIGAENNTYAPLTSSYLQLPYVLPRDANGNYRNTGFIQNVLAIEELNTNFFGNKRIIGNVYAEATLLKGLTFRTDFGIDNFEAQAKYRSVNLIDPGGYAYRDIQSDNKWLTTNTLNYNFKVGAINDFNVLAGYSFETSDYRQVLIEGSGFASDGLPNIGSASTPTTTNENGTNWALESQFLRANYRYDNKYMLELNARRDGSSRFGANNRYGTFWAVGAGWIISEESFLKGNKTINFLKLSASYGTAGNDRIGDFPSLALYGGGTASDYGGQPGLRPTQTPNPDLTWEETAQADIGISATLFNNLLNLDINFYQKTTTALLLNVPYPFTTGFPSAARNVGKMQNSGIDLDIRANIVNKSNFGWSVGLNMGFLKNEVTELPDAAINAVDSTRFFSGSTAQRAVVGRSLNEFYLVRAKGVNPETGHFEWLDIDGNPTTTYTTNNRVYAGSAIPKFFGGLSTNLRFGDFDMSLLFNFTYGNKVLIDGLRFTDNVLSPGFNKSTELLNYWTESNRDAYVPSLSSPTINSFNQLSTLQLQDGSFFRLRNLNIGYTLPTRLLNNQNVFRSLRVYVLGQNLFLIKNKDFRGPDPEVSANGPNNVVQGESFFALPQPRTITIGINVGF